MKEEEVLSKVKVGGSYGVSGEEEGIGNYN